MRPLAIPFRGRILGYPMVLRPASATQTPLLLDLVTGAAAAYSLRKLRNAYAGSAVRVRRSSDNSEQDIGFSGNDFDTSAFSSFIGGGSGYVATWYDQSGNGYNATQVTAANQPQVVLNAQNGKAILRFDGTDDYLTGGDILESSPLALIVAHAIRSNNPMTIASKAGDNNNGSWVLWWRYTQSAEFRWTGNGDGSTNVLSSGIGYSSAMRLLVAQYNSSTGAFEFRVNGAAAGSGTGSTGKIANSTVPFELGRRNDGSYYSAIDYADVVIYNATLSSVQSSSIESDINTYYAIY